MLRSFKAFTTVLLVTFASLAFVACGGGAAGGGGGGGGGEFLQLATEPGYGVMGTVNAMTAFNVLTPSTTSSVGANDFASATGTDVNYLEFSFNTTVLATSVTGNGVTGAAGLVVRSSAGAEMPYFFDSTGVIDPTNAFPMPGIAPATLRIYFENPLAPGVPIALPVDKYSVALLPTNLRSGAGRAFCVVKNSGLCLNDTNCVYHFTLDGMNSTAGAVALTSGPTVALPLPAIAQIDDEIRLFFSDQVDFQSIVGFNTATGISNATTLDPFCSVPFALNAVAAGANIRVNLTQPAPQVVLPNYGYIVYMPNPFRDATEVRIRFVDLTLVSGRNDPTGATTGGTPVFQNYALASAVWQSARLGATALTAPMDTNLNSTTFGMPLELPAKLSLPGSNSNGTTSLAITLFSATNVAAADSSAGSVAPDGVLGVTDRARRTLAQDIQVMRTMGNGPIFTNNPEVPDLHLVANGRILDGIDAAGVTVDGFPGSTLTGSLFRIAQPLDDINTLESIGDIEFGAFVNGNNPNNNINNPPRRLNHAGVLATKLLPQNINNPAVPSPGVPFPPGGTPEFWLLQPMMVPAPTQPLGLRLYVADIVRNRVQVINSNTFQPIAVLPGLSSPRGLGRFGTFLYVSNFDQNTISRVGINPLQATTFHKLVSTTPVGPGPTTVSVQAGGEDVVVLNSLANSISFVDVPTFLQRAQLPVGQGPREIAVSGRWTGMGTTFAYQAYITNQFSNSVTIYESDTPLITEQNGPNGKILQEFGGFNSPLWGVSNLFVGAFNGIGCQGMLVPNSAGSTVTYMGMINFGLGVPPGLPGPAGFRTFASVIEYASNSPTGPTDCAIENGTLINSNPQTQRLILALFPAAGQMASIDFFNGAYYGGVSIPGTRMFTFVDQ